MCDVGSVAMARVFTQRVVPAALGITLLAATVAARNGMAWTTEPWVTTGGFLSAALGLFARAAWPARATIMASTALLFLTATARLWAVVLIDLPGYETEDRIYSSGLWAFFALLAVDLGLTGMASLVLNNEE